MRRAEMTHSYEPFGAVRCFLQEECPEGWSLMRVKPVEEIPAGASGQRVITCVKLGEKPTWGEVEVLEGEHEWQGR